MRAVLLEAEIAYGGYSSFFCERAYGIMAPKQGVQDV